jgi:vanillate O-demethylase ferredoxin subunit
VRQLKLARRDGHLLPPFTPGAHIDLHLAPGLVRQYSLCGAMEVDTHYTVAVKLEPQSRGGSRAVHEQLAPGSELSISPPRNNFPMDLEAPHSVLIGGGIGITPLLCMARALVRRGRSFRLHYFARSEEHAAFLDVLRQPGFAQSTELHLGKSHEATEASLREALCEPRPGAQVYLCGPRAFMDLVCHVAAAQGWPKANVHLEYFNAGQQEAAVTTEHEVRVTLARSGLTVPVPPGAVLIDVLRAAGVSVDTSCEQGVCGTCVTRVLDGTPEHRDLFLTDEEKARGDCMALCVSRALTPHLVLDL